MFLKFKVPPLTIVDIPNVGAIAASIGRKKYGAKKMTAMAVAGRKKGK